MDFWLTTDFWITFVSRFFTIGASGIAIWVFVFKRTEAANALNLLINYATRISISDLLQKVRQLNQYSNPDPDTGIEHKEELLDLLASINGHLKGNKRLGQHFKDEVKTITRYMRNPNTLSKPKNRELAHILEQKLLSLGVEYFKIQND